MTWPDKLSCLSNGRPSDQTPNRFVLLPKLLRLLLEPEVNIVLVVWLLRDGVDVGAHHVGHHQEPHAVAAQLVGSLLHGLEVNLLGGLVTIVLHLLKVFLCVHEKASAGLHSLDELLG